MPATLLQINSVINTGSTGRIAEQLGAVAIERGWNSYIAYGREARKSGSKVIRIGRKFDIYIHAIASKLLDAHGVWSRRATRRLLRKIEAIRPDVVHIHNLHGYYIHYPMLLEYLRDNKIPTVITLHDFWLMTGHCAYINKSCDRWKFGCGQCKRLNQYPASLKDASAENWRLKASLFGDMPNVVLVPVSYWLDGYVRQSLMKGVKSQVIHNGIDTDVFKPYEESVGTIPDIDWEKFSVLCVATRWTDANGFRDIIRLSELIGSECQIIMVGLDENQMKRLPSNIVGLQRTESLVQLQELYTKSDVVFNPNTEVTFGLVSAESMACGTPVIVLRNTAGEEIVDAQTGYVVDSVEEVPKLIERIKRDYAVGDISNKCRMRVIEHFNAGVQCRRYMELYERLKDSRQ